MLIAVVVAGNWLAAPSQAAAPAAITVMTRNMYIGADLDAVFAADDLGSFAQAAATILQQVKQSDFQERAARVAEEVAAHRPDLISLQEVALWRTGALLEPPATDVLYDQLDLLLTELGKRKLHYGVVAIQYLVDAEAPIPTAGIDLRLTDRDVILARLDMPQSVFDLTNAQTHRYQTILRFGSPLLGEVALPRGWLSVDVAAGGAKFRFVATHLESTIPGLPAAQQAQEAQAAELVAALAADDVPVVVAGDFNSNAEAGPEQTASFHELVMAGFADAWRAAHPTDPGLTWPVYLAGAPTATPDERIDLVFTRGLKPRGFTLGLPILSAERTGTAPGRFASDHAGVVVTFQAQ